MLNSSLSTKSVWLLLSVLLVAACVESRARGSASSAAAVLAVRQWRYSPTLLNSEPVEVDTTMDVIFTLNR